jgi:exodeoxyribonuclease V alpha subunit
VINITDGIIRVQYTNGKIENHTQSDHPDMDLAYAITIHKAQGSEFPVVIVPCFEALGRRMLSRNLLYTAITRAKECAVLIGSRQSLDIALKRNEAEEHLSLMDQLIQDAAFAATSTEDVGKLLSADIAPSTEQSEYEQLTISFSA